ncbi:MAG: hypothetical protein HY211_08500 [Candidatus Omnitrophica bacterium]|nr:hypothetical protein [Candidatus Omnitrophota bacterium]
MKTRLLVGQILCPACHDAVFVYQNQRGWLYWACQSCGVSTSIWNAFGIARYRAIAQWLGLYLKPIPWSRVEPVPSLMGRRNLLAFCAGLLEQAGPWNGHYPDEEDGRRALIQMLNQERTKIDVALLRYPT